jgi:hypothetical protein
MLSPSNMRTQTLECVEAGLILSVSYSKVEELYVQNPAFGFYFLRLASARLFTERWLHMIDRALTKQPAAVAEVVRSIGIVSGHGAGYRLALANWDLIISRLAKPVFDGDLVLPQLAEALGRARSAALSDPGGEELRRIVADIRAEAEQAPSRRAVGS